MLLITSLGHSLLAQALVGIYAHRGPCVLLKSEQRILDGKKDALRKWFVPFSFTEGHSKPSTRTVTPHLGDLTNYGPDECVAILPHFSKPGLVCTHRGRALNSEDEARALAERLMVQRYYDVKASEWRLLRNDVRPSPRVSRKSTEPGTLELEYT